MSVHSLASKYYYVIIMYQYVSMLYLANCWTMLLYIACLLHSFARTRAVPASHLPDHASAYLRGEWCAVCTTHLYPLVVECRWLWRNSQCLARSCIASLRWTNMETYPAHSNKHPNSVYHRFLILRPQAVRTSLERYGPLQLDKSLHSMTFFH